MKLLVTGGAGFIGSNFIRHILNKYPDYRVVNFDKLTYAGNLENLKDIESNSRYKFIKGDICDKEAVREAVRDVDAIINFAAETHVDRSIMDDNAFIKTDINGVKNLLETVKELRIKKMVQISTDEVYGDLARGGFAKESDLLEPSSPYSASKAGGDLLCLAYKRTYNVPIIITRSSNNYGPYQYPEKIMPLFITNLLEDKKVPVYGDGAQIRDWLYVEDNCEAIDLVLHKGELGEIYNIGANQDPEIDNLTLTKEIIKACLPAPRPGAFCTYAIKCEDGSIYIGHTDDLMKRWQKHLMGTASDWTKKHKPTKIVHHEIFTTREVAIKREKELKTGFGRKWLRREIAAGRARQAGGKDENCIEYVKDRPGHDGRYAVDTQKIRVLGWEPKLSFENGLTKTIEWYKNNIGWWKHIKTGEYLEYYKQQYNRSESTD